MRKTPYEILRSFEKGKKPHPLKNKSNKCNYMENDFLPTFNVSNKTILYIVFMFLYLLILTLSKITANLN